MTCKQARQEKREQARESLRDEPGNWKHSGWAFLVYTALYELGIYRRLWPRSTGLMPMMHLGHSVALDMGSEGPDSRYLTCLHRSVPTLATPSWAAHVGAGDLSGACFLVRHHPSAIHGGHKHQIGVLNRDSDGWDIHCYVYVF